VTRLLLTLVLGATIPFAAEPGYVDPASCRPCHTGIYDAYSATGMGRSIVAPSDHSGIARETVRFRHAASASTFTIQRSGRRLGFRHEEARLDVEIVAFVGSGRHSRTPVHRKPNGKLAELPLSWYSEGSGYWAMSPGFDRANHSGLRRELSDGCLFCHAAYPSGDIGIAAIDCQRCHGPGSAHIRSRTPAMNPARLSSARRLEVCLQCHLETGSRITPDAIRRVGRAPFSYRPGEPLGDFQIYFAAENPPVEDGILVNGAGAGLLASTCFQRSGGRIECLSCHDPHGVRKMAADTVCAGCHEKPHEEDRRACTACHMPKRRTSDAVHVVMTDHRIRGRPTDADALEQKPEKHGAFNGPVKLLYPAVSEPAPENQAYLGIAARSPSVLSGAIRRMADPPAEFLFELGRLDALRAGMHWRSAVAADPSHLPSRLALCGWLIQQARPAEALEVARQAPGESAPLLNAMSVALVSLRRYAEAFQVLQRARKADEWDPLTHLNSGVVFEALSDHDGAIRAYRRALQLQPDSELARENLKRLGFR
jgi:hypothetical protein